MTCLSPSLLDTQKATEDERCVERHVKRVLRAVLRRRDKDRNRRGTRGGASASSPQPHRQAGPEAVSASEDVNSYSSCHFLLDS